MEDIFTGVDWGGLNILEAKQITKHGRPQFINDRVSTVFYQLGAKFSGETIVNYNGKFYEYSAGTILFLPKERETNIVYNRNIIEPGEGVYIFFDSKEPLFDRPVVLPLADNPQVRELLLKIAALHLRDDRIGCMENFYRLLSKLRDETQKVEYGARSRLDPALGFIEEHLCDEFIDLSELAELCGMTPDYFRHCFRRTFRVSPLQYINHRKAGFAKKLLGDEQKSVSEVAALMGFSSGSYFARFFRQHAGMSPSEYRELGQKMS